MALDEFLKLVGEGPYPMMLLLPGNVGSYLCDIGFRHRKGAIASSPRKFTLYNVVGVDRMGRASPLAIGSIPRSTDWLEDRLARGRDRRLHN